jgi:hypothetical protein
MPDGRRLVAPPDMHVAHVIEGGAPAPNCLKPIDQGAFRIEGHTAPTRLLSSFRLYRRDWPSA